MSHRPSQSKKAQTPERRRSLSFEIVASPLGGFGCRLFEGTVQIGIGAADTEIEAMKRAFASLGKGSR